MNSNVTRIQLLEGEAEGFLDVKNDVNVPLNFSISDVRDLSSRTGMFSKTIKLAGTKNNNLLLNNYFEVNVKSGKFSINKRQKCAIIQNGVVIIDNCYLRLLKVNGIESRSENVDELVEYEVQIKDSLGDFFKEVNNYELADLNLSEYDHNYNTANILSSFSHTIADGYKYVLPWIDDSKYYLNELLPGIYAKKYWDKIHEEAGYTYNWDEISDDNVRFDDLVIPYSGDKKKLGEEFSEQFKVIATDASTQNSGYGSSNGQGAVSNIPALFPDIATTIQDDENLYNNVTSQYFNTFDIVAPNALVYTINIEFDLVYKNFGSSNAVLSSNQTNKHTPYARVYNQVNSLKGSTSLTFTSIDPALQGTGTINLLNNNQTVEILGVARGSSYTWTPGDHVVASGNVEREITLTSVNQSDNLRFAINALTTQGAGAFWRKQGSFDTIPMYPRLVIKDITVTIAPSKDTIITGTPLKMNLLIPKKVKQADFLKAIYQKYNLYAEIDKNDPVKILYKSRDKFYDDGDLHDWTKKREKKIKKSVTFIPELSKKKIILSYKDDDKDFLLSSYIDEVGETFGQVEVTFENENVKGIERKEEIFSPTMNLPTTFNSNAPALNAKLDYKLRILIDGGQQNCGVYEIDDSAGNISTVTTYPFMSMFDQALNPKFSIEYGQADYYPYNLGQPTANNLYTNYWRRTLSQINSGKMLTAYFWLTEADVQELKLNDKIKVDSSLWYINKIIDYNANKNTPTQVELLSVEDDLTLPRFGKNVGPTKPGVYKPIPVPYIPNGGIIGGLKPAVGKFVASRNDATSINNSLGAMNRGKGNVISADFQGFVTGDGVTANKPGIYAGNTYIGLDGSIRSIEPVIIDGGLNNVYPVDKTNDTDINDGGKNVVRTFGAINKSRFVIDPNLYGLENENI